MNSTPKKCYQVDQGHPGHSSMMNYRYDGQQLQQRSNNQNAVQQSMPEGDQMQYRPLHPAHIHPTYVYPQTTPEYGASNQGQLHQENMVSGQLQSAMNPQSLNLSGVTGNQQSMGQYITTYGNEYGQNQNYGTYGQMQPLSNCSSGYSTYPPSVNNAQQQQGQNVNSTEIYEFLYHPKSAETYNHNNYGKAPQQQTPNHQSTRHARAHSVAKESSDMPSSSRKRMNNTMNPTNEKRKKGRPTKYACDKHKPHGDVTCDECKKLKKEPRNESSNTYIAKLTSERDFLERHVEQLEKAFYFVKNLFTGLRNQLGLSAHDTESIDATLYEPEIATDLPAAAVPIKEGKHRKSNPSKKTLAVRKSRAKTKDGDLVNCNKSNFFATKLGQFADVFEHMEVAVELRIVAQQDYGAPNYLA